MLRESVSASENAENDSSMSTRWVGPQKTVVSPVAKGVGVAVDFMVYGGRGGITPPFNLTLTFST
jgi:hypothetical protein